MIPIYLMDRETYPETFENVDYSEDYIAIEPKTPCPVLYGIRSNTVEALERAKKIVLVEEPVENYCIFKTNQHTDMHIQKTDDIASNEQFDAMKLMGTVKTNQQLLMAAICFLHL